ncbi:MAG: carbohydrate ABC transporter permease [Actinobacteria bacterium]|nr:carbohydrate ABC transporter permease [Actinomycetota bacterium]
MSNVTLNTRKEQAIFNKLLIYILFIIFAILTLYPLIWLFYSSFKPILEIIRNALALPRDWIFSNYIQAIKIGKLNIYAVNSIIYTFVSTGLVIIFSMMASFAFAKIKNRATPFLYNSFLIGLLITIQAILIPLFISMTRIGLRDTRLGIIMIYVAINLPLAIFLGTEYVKAIPDSLIESAQIDGASYFRIFFSIIMPMCKPVMVTILIFTALACWNEFMLALVFTSSDSSRSLPVGIYSFSGPLATEYGMQFAALVIGMAPMIILYALFHRQITRGFAAGGAIKG